MEKSWKGGCYDRNLYFPTSAADGNTSGKNGQNCILNLPSAKIIERTGRKYLIEAEVYGDGIKMWLLSQGPWVKVISPEDFRDEVKYRLRKALEQHEGQA